MEYDYRTQEHEMLLEGTSYYKPDRYNIIDHARVKGFYLVNLDIWFDHFQEIWRFRADLIIISKIETK